MTRVPVGTDLVLGSNRYIKIELLSDFRSALGCYVAPLIGKVLAVAVEFVLKLVVILMFSDGR